MNSAARLKRVRAWLEKIPGVRFESARQLDLDDERPLDDELPDPNEPEFEPAQGEALEQIYLKHCRRWLDEPVPALSNATPRECAKTAGGRQRVARLIRSMPAVPMPWGTMEPPREELLREQGIRR